MAGTGVARTSRARTGRAGAGKSVAEMVGVQSPEALRAEEALGEAWPGGARARLRWEVRGQAGRHKDQQREDRRRQEILAHQWVWLG